ncbi:restriction endonuclease subunit R [Dysgonomonas sp. 521]|uniref:DEAD/DEAH box helicase family protein n=1 Tax=Dysgonomonas sp. 521 TaxID=2302932 RepID=UPI0013D7A7AE|nr:DEAD/DEAH box helicase family protein [Dysgonomonas sp. 521]NDV93898.1 restriction endonuclease subunit R [Dysgonomonas sp. 521]
MKTFPSDTKFKYPWRKYQQKVLDELDYHLEDRHLHVVAPPGSGKTVLGLEVALRLNKPTLILAPSLTIRNQWIQRFCELFLDTHKVPEWISTDIRRPAFMTVVTYQGLHSACSGQAENEEDEPEEEHSPKKTTTIKPHNKSNLASIVRGLKSVDIGTIVVDEAHHLMNEWWHTLIKVKEQLDPFVVGLTATPPYDVTYTEWRRYLDLNGSIDTEISIPELIIEGDLCPHQDHIYFSMPTVDEYQKINKFRKDMNDLYQKLTHSDVLIKAITSIPAWNQPESYLDWIYDNLPIYTSCIVFLHANHIEIPLTHLKIVTGIEEEKELSKVKIPELLYERIEILLNFFLFQGKGLFNGFEEEKESLMNQLRRYGVLERNKVNLLYNQRINKLLVSSNSKINSIKEIVDFEHSHLQSELRMVILSDFIRSEYLMVNNISAEINKIGVIPIFEYLRRNNNDNKQLGVLTGSISIIPINAISRFHELCAKFGFTELDPLTYEYIEGYRIIKTNAALKNKLVQIITQLFQEGEIEILIGTKSLLGEGWDAPAINSLVLASFVGSFVLSNQMRGRAIRTQKDNLSKTSNIWHLVCIDPTVENGGTDLEVMGRRFRSFVGLSNNEEPTIENGVQRLNVLRDSYTEEIVRGINIVTLKEAGSRHTLKEKWEKAIAGGVQIVEEIKIPFYSEKGIEYTKQKKLYMTNTIKYLMADLGLVLVAFGSQFIESLLQNIKALRTPKDFYYFFILMALTGLFVCGRQTYRTLKLYIKYRDIAKDIQQIGNALLAALLRQGTMISDPARLRAVGYSDESGAIYCYLEGGSTFEQAVFVDSMQEIVNVIENPRYIIIRKSKFLAEQIKRDYHAVPEILGRNKKMAQYFSRQWMEQVGPCELIYTRTVDGRKQLLEARVKALSANFTDDNISEQVNKWK